LTFFILEKWERSFYDKIFIFFTGVMTFSSILVLQQYFAHQEEMVELLKVGKAIPTPCHHIRYSIMLSFAAITAFYLLLTSAKREIQLAMAALFTILLIALHVLAVRTGLISFYLGFLTLLIWQLFHIGRSWWILGLFVGFLASPFIAYKTSDSFKQKMDYVKYDYEQLVKGNWDSHSDSERIISLKAGWQLFKNNKILGVGIGDLKYEMDKIYQNEYNRSKAKFPHNQFLFVLAGCGLIGGLIFFTGFLLPIILGRPETWILFLGFYLIILFSFLVENTIESAVGTAIPVFWISIFLKQWKDGQ
jgi:O-antigen ligase